jgi:hypothetical protein
MRIACCRAWREIWQREGSVVDGEGAALTDEAERNTPKIKYAILRQTEEGCAHEGRSDEKGVFRGMFSICSEFFGSIFQDGLKKKHPSGCAWVAALPESTIDCVNDVNPR